MASDLLQIGRSGTQVARIALDIAAQNIANAASEGYVRRSVRIAEIAPPNGLSLIGDVSVSGARVDGIVRNADSFRQAEVRRFMHDRLFGPVGLTSMTGEYDAAGTLIGGAMIHATARDWGQFGEFLRHGGAVRGAQVVPRGWIAFMRRPSPRAPDYGAGLWLNRNSGNERRVLFPGQGDPGLFAMAGHLGQYVLVSPAQKLTIVRFGRTDEANTRKLMDDLSRIAALYPSE